MSTRIYVQTPMSEEQKKKFLKASRKQGMTGAAVGRALFEAFAAQVGKGERLVPPFRICNAESPASNGKAH